jgi:cytochrome d ubiquinol oxidase subunit I
VGYVVHNGKFIVENWHDIVFNPATMPRFLHMLFASYTAAFFVILGVAAFYLKKKLYTDFATANFKFAAWALAILMPIQIFLGDMSGLNVYKYQPLKTAAIEAVWNTQSGAPLLLFAWPNQEMRSNQFEIGVPSLGSLLNTHKLNGTLVGLNTVDASEQPLVWPVFFSFRLMVGIGVVMLLLAYIAVVMAIRNKLDNNKKLSLFIYSPPLGFLAIWFGWITAELGRQPWAVYGLIKTKDAVSSISLYDSIVSLVLIFIIYGIVFGYFYFYFLDKTIRSGPELLDSVHSENIGPFEYMSPINLNNQDRK